MDVLITPIERRGRPGPCRVLPFSLCQKTVGARFCGRARRLRETLHTMVQPQYIRLSVFPTHTHHGIKIRLLKARVAPVPRSVVMPLPLARSEEHTSELQSLMRISYAVFCLKKKKNKHTTTNK